MSLSHKKLMFYLLFIVLGLERYSCYGSQDFPPDNAKRSGGMITLDIISQKYKLLGLLPKDKEKAKFRKRGELVWRDIPDDYDGEKIDIKKIKNKLIFNFDPALEDREFIFFLKIALNEDIYIRGMQISPPEETAFERGVIFDLSNPPTQYALERDLDIELSAFKTDHNLIRSDYSVKTPVDAVIDSTLPVLFAVINPNENLGRWFKNDHTEDYKAFRNQLLATTKTLSTGSEWYDKWARTYFATWYYEQNMPDIIITQEPSDLIDPAWEDASLFDRLKYFNAVIEFDRVIDHVDQYLSNLKYRRPNNDTRGIIVYYLGAPSSPLSENDLTLIDQKLKDKRLKAVIIPFLHYEAAANNLTSDFSQYDNLRMTELSVPTEYKNGYFTSIQQIVEELCSELINPMK